MYNLKSHKLQTLLLVGGAIGREGHNPIYRQKCPYTAEILQQVLIKKDSHNYKVRNCSRGRHVHTIIALWCSAYVDDEHSYVRYRTAEAM